MRTTSANHVIHAVTHVVILADRSRILAAAASIIINVRSQEDNAFRYAFPIIRNQIRDTVLPQGGVLLPIQNTF